MSGLPDSFISHIGTKSSSTRVQILNSHPVVYFHMIFFFVLLSAANEGEASAT